MKKKIAMIVGLVLVLVLVGVQFVQIRGLQTSADDAEWRERGLQRQVEYLQRQVYGLEDDVWFNNLTDSEKAECMITKEEFVEMFEGTFHYFTPQPDPKFVYYDSVTKMYYWKPITYDWRSTIERSVIPGLTPGTVYGPWRLSPKG